MPLRYLSLLIALMFIYASGAYAARDLDGYDLDSLSALAGAIVKVEIDKATPVKTRDGDCAVWDVKVLATLHGDVKPQSTIRVVGIEEYRKGPGTGGAQREFPQLSKGDIVYLFLAPKGARIGYAMYDLTDADWKVIESGARLVINDRVYAFGQYVPPPPSLGSVGFVALTEQTSPAAPVLAVDTFEKQVLASLEFVRELRDRLSTTGLTKAERNAILDARPAVLKRDSAHTDYIPNLIYDEPHRPATRPLPQVSP